MFGALSNVFSKDLKEFASITGRLVSGTGPNADGVFLGDEDTPIGQDTSHVPRSPLATLQEDPKTYTEPIASGEETAFHVWLANGGEQMIDVEKDGGERMRNLIEKSDVVNAFYRKWVKQDPSSPIRAPPPASVGDDAERGTNDDAVEEADGETTGLLSLREFFGRYFFRLSVERRRLSAIQREEERSAAAATTRDSSMPKTSSNSQLRTDEDPWGEEEGPSGTSGGAGRKSEETEALSIALEASLIKNKEFEKVIDNLTSEVQRLQRENVRLREQLAVATTASPGETVAMVEARKDSSDDPSSIPAAAGTATATTATAEGGDDDDYADWAEVDED